MKAVAKAYGHERLIDMSKEEFVDGLAEKLNKLSDRSVLRAFHFYEENERVDALEKALDNNDYATFEKCINDSGISSLNKLQNCYVGGSVDQAIPKALAIAKNFDCACNRVHGGGFAGTTLNIVKNDKANDFILSMAKFYGEENVIPLKVRSVGTIVL